VPCLLCLLPSLRPSLHFTTLAKRTYSTILTFTHNTYHTHQVLESSLHVEGGGLQLPLLHMAAVAGKVGHPHATPCYTFLLCYSPLARRAACCVVVVLLLLLLLHLLSRYTIPTRSTVCCCCCSAGRRLVAAIR